MNTKSLPVFVITVLVSAVTVYTNTFIIFMMVTIVLFLVMIYGRWRRLTLMVTVVYVGYVLLFSFNIEAESELKPMTSNFIGKIVTIPDIDGDQLTFIFKERYSEERLHFSYKIPTKKQKADLQNHLQPGMTCHLKGRLEKPRPPSNFHAFNYTRYLKHQNIFWLLNADSPPDCKKGQKQIISALKAFRGNGIHYVQQNYPDMTAGIVNALVFGERRFLPPDLLEAYQAYGLIHLLAVSGLHVGVVIGLLYFGFLRTGLIKEHVSILILIIILPAYIILTGAAPSIVRASLMFAAVLIARMTKHPLNAVDAVCAAFLIFLLVRPDALFDVGFQLSFMVTAAIVLSAPVVERRYSGVITKMFFYSSAAQLAAFPLLIFYFYHVSLYSYLLNLIFIPLITLVVLPTAFLTFLPVIGTAVQKLLEIILSIAHDVIMGLYGPAVELLFGKPVLWFLMLTVILVIIGFLVWEKINTHWSLFIPAGVVLLLFLIDTGIDRLNSTGQVTFLDVGQGDSILIQLPYTNGNILIDTGGRSDYYQPKWRKRRDPFAPGKDIVLPELKAMGVRAIDFLILTHSDQDHAAGLKHLVGKVKIHHILINHYFQPLAKQRQLLNKAEQFGTQVWRLKVNDTWTIGGAEFRIVSALNDSFSDNNRSLVLSANFGGTDWLFAGDLEREGEKLVLRRFPELSTDILKVGHHGSATSTSSEWLRALQPNIAVVSAGKWNRYGHPAEATIMRLKNSGVKIYRTDRDGAIQIEFIKNRLIRIHSVK